jgi:hypothetical protein
VGSTFFGKNLHFVGSEHSEIRTWSQVVNLFFAQRLVPKSNLHNFKADICFRIKRQSQSPKDKECLSGTNSIFGFNQIYI